MKEKLHKNYKTAAKLVFLTLWLDIIELFFSYSSWVKTAQLGFVVTGILFTLFTSYVIWRGVNWVKYILLIIILLSVAGIALSLKDSLSSYRTIAVTFLQVILMIVATILLFKIPVDKEEDSLDSDI